MQQPDLLHGEHLPPRLRYQSLFGFLPALPHAYRFGRPMANPNAMLRALIYRCLRGISTLSDLHYGLAENPALAEAMGFDPFKPPPSIERFSCWLRSTPHHALESVRFQLAQQLVAQHAIEGKVLSFDSTPVASPLRENNLKTTVPDRFNKHRYPKTDPEARLGVYRCYMASATQKIRYFWGYRNHALVDFETELPLAQETHPPNHHEIHVAIPLLEAGPLRLKLNPQVVCGDSAYDVERILGFIIEQLHAQPVIAPNARYQANPHFRIQGKEVLCPASLPMIRKGRMTPKRTGITYTQYACPLHYSKSLRQKYLLCPANHPKFLSQKGCNYLLRHTTSYRDQISYGSEAFVVDYQKRTSVERAFARLLALAMQKPTVHGLQAIRNHCTIAHITALLVATAAFHTGHPDKLAFVRSFVPKFMSGA
jgi:hypothetical protein